MSLASLLGEDLHLTNIRAKRDKPGLRPQHLAALLACCEMTGGAVEGAEVGSREIFYHHGSPEIQGQDFSWDIGTAGSTTMLAFSILPLAIFSRISHSFTISGGLFQDFAPSAYHMQHVLLPSLAKMGVKAELKVLQPGYVPQGQGKLQLITHPAGHTPNENSMRSGNSIPGGEPSMRGEPSMQGISLNGISLLAQGSIQRLWGISLSSHLESQKVSQRMAETCRDMLRKAGFDAQFELIEDTSAVQKGAALFLAAYTRTGCIFGADMAGKVGRRAEQIGAQVARMLLTDLLAGATVDRHLADQLILFAGLARGTTEYSIPCMTEHVETNLWLVKEILGAKTFQKGTQVRVEGIGFLR